MFKKLFGKLKLKIKKIKFNRSIKLATKAFYKESKATRKLGESFKNFGEVCGVKYE